ncbi:helix-turn-helix transcriptional regulator [Longispora albida]|uniref:helix-turn-helix transcriptional regulator n=1 Tax=Longispora albida TaxID=203523 RepID=UPI00037AF1B4|nr:helix-turn-helix transcriptional regulator [Longispora albida]
MTTRRTELAAFLRSRRDRISPETAGLPPGARRRTPGLRREEVAQLAGVGVTWYTWLEQGRPINASVQVLDAIARTLRLDAAERMHLYQLADITSAPPAPDGGCQVPDEVQTVLDALAPLLGCVYNTRYDLLAWNEPYRRLFPNLCAAPEPERNAIWQTFMCPPKRSPYVNPEQDLPFMVARLRAGFGAHVGEPAWTDFVRRLSAASPEFVRLWSAHDVADSSSRVKIFRHPRADGEIRLVSTTFGMPTPPETRMVVYTPTDEDSRRRLSLLDGALLE